VQMAAPAPGARTITPAGRRAIICDVDGTQKNAAVVPRASLEPGDRVPGPALITEPQTTTLVSADFSASVDGACNLVLVRDRQETNR